MKKYLLLFLVIFIFSFLKPVNVLAISGACSDHGGVNCSAGADPYGNVQCNDGWVNSSVAFSDTDECKSSCNIPDYTKMPCGEFDKPEYDQLTNMLNKQISHDETQNQQICSYEMQQTEGLIQSSLNSCLKYSSASFCQTAVAVFGDPQSKYNTCINQDICGYDAYYKAELACITLKPQVNDASCQTSDGVNSYAKDGNCYCSDGYMYNATKKYCESTLEVTQNQNLVCQQKSGQYAVMTSLDNPNSCSCQTGYQFDSNNQCVAITVATPEPETPVVSPVVVSVVQPQVKSATISAVPIKKQSIALPKKIIKESTQTTAPFTPAQIQSVNNPSVSGSAVASAPVKKLTWYQKIFNWLFK